MHAAATFRQRGTCKKIDEVNPDATGVSVRTEGRQPRTRKEQDIDRAVKEHAPLASR